MNVVRLLTAVAAFVGLIFAVWIFAEREPVLSSTLRTTAEAPVNVWLDIIVDTGGRELAAYEIELEVLRGDAEIIDVAGGAHPAFSSAPDHDPQVLRGQRVVLSARSTSPDLPRGAGRLVSVHVREKGAQPSYAISLRRADDAQSRPIDARFEIRRRPARLPQ